MKIYSKKGLIVFLDLLGTRGSWLRNDPSKLHKAIGEIIDIAHRGTQQKTDRNLLKDLLKIEGKDDSKLIMPEKRFYSFSDTLIFTITGSSDIWNLIESCNIFSIIINKGIDSGLFFRGSISYGNFFQNKDPKYPFINGPAVDEVSDWFESLSWIGLNYAPSASYLIDHIIQKNKGRYKSLFKYFAKYNTPLKNGKYFEGWVVNWPLFTGIALEAFPYLDDQKKFEEYFNKSVEFVNKKDWLLQKFSENSIRVDDYEKFSNTIIFYDEIMKKSKNSI